MKTRLLFTLLLMTTVLTFGQVELPVYEGFDYPVGSTLLDSDTMTGQGPWTEDNYGSTKNPFLINSPFTSYAGLPSFTGNAIEIKGGTNDPLLYFESVSEDDGVDLYASCMIQVTDMSAITGNLDYFFALATSGFGYGAALYFEKSGTDTTYNLGINESNTSSEAIIYTGETFNVGDVLFVVIKYAFDKDGNSIAYLFVNPTISGTTEPAPTADTSSLTIEDEANRSSLTLLKINANSNARTPGIAIDEIRIGTSWADVVTNGSSLSVSENQAVDFTVYPNPASDYINVESKAGDVESIDVFNILGKQVLTQKELKNGRVNISSLTKGIYFMKINGENNSSVTKKIVIK